MSSALCPQVVSQASQHFRSSEKQATCSICSVVSLHAGMSRAVHPQEYFVQCCFTSTETAHTIRDRESRMSTSSFTQLLSLSKWAELFGERRQVNWSGRAKVRILLLLRATFCQIGVHLERDIIIYSVNHVSLRLTTCPRCIGISKHGCRIWLLLIEFGGVSQTSNCDSTRYNTATSQ